LKSLLCYRDDDETIRLGIKSSGFRAIENFIQARFQLYVQVYYHKTNRAVELMLAELGKAADKEEEDLISTASLGELVSGYVVISDDRFLDELASGKFGEEIKRVATEICDRTLWKRVEDFREALSEPEDEDSFVCELETRCPGCKGALIRDQVKPKATKDLNQGAALLFRDESGVYRASRRHSWQNISPLIQVLAAQEEKIVRVYYKGGDPQTAKNCRLEALKLETEFRGNAA
jgi:HD superfamily phosphohydrolase